MELTRREQQMLNGELGEAVQQSMEILVALGKIYGAKSMIPISSSQVAGVSYKTIGDAGLEYLKDIAKKGARVGVPTFLNPAGMDRRQWRQLRIPAKFAKKQLEILRAYSKMGIMASCTCTPYLAGIRPKRGEHVAWSESSAVAFANSVLGARTNREGGPSALAAAICGVTPNYGLHLDENRVAGFVVRVEAELKTAADFGALGYAIGEMAKGRNVAFAGIKSASEDQLKSLGAAIAATGSTALFYVKGITPEYVEGEAAEEVAFTQRELEETKEKMGVPEQPQLVAIGCPHASIEEIREVAQLVKGKRLACDLWVCTARKNKERADRLGYTAAIEKAGGKIVADTCMVVCPIEDMGYRATATNSGKSAKYLPSMCGQKVVFGDLKDIIRVKK
ncbi:MAG: aconitase X catalytic domain-containing protein [Candidatus Micrarchaeota archaeon]|nr:aconitase X catalytic domain-containing protein [Candidatus Micrarchaeota archaeon]